MTRGRDHSCRLGEHRRDLSFNQVVTEDGVLRSSMATVRAIQPVNEALAAALLAPNQRGPAFMEQITQKPDQPKQTDKAGPKDHLAFGNLVAGLTPPEPSDCKNHYGDT